MKETLVETLSGSGAIAPLDGDGEVIPAIYLVAIYDTLRSVGGGEYIRTGCQIRGTVRKENDLPFMVSSVGKHYTLTINDGRKLDFFFRNQRGTIANSGGMRSVT